MQFLTFRNNRNASRGRHCLSAVLKPPANSAVTTPRDALSLSIGTDNLQSILLHAKCCALLFFHTALSFLRHVRSARLHARFSVAPKPRLRTVADVSFLTGLMPTKRHASAGVVIDVISRNSAGPAARNTLTSQRYLNLPSAVL